jgi:hypothetical protein
MSACAALITAGCIQTSIRIRPREPGIAPGFFIKESRYLGGMVTAHRRTFHDVFLYILNGISETVQSI